MLRMRDNVPFMSCSGSLIINTFTVSPFSTELNINDLVAEGAPAESSDGCVSSVHADPYATILFPLI